VGFNMDLRETVVPLLIEVIIAEHLVTRLEGQRGVSPTELLCARKRAYDAPLALLDAIPEGMAPGSPAFTPMLIAEEESSSPTPTETTRAAEVRAILDRLEGKSAGG